VQKSCRIVVTGIGLCTPLGPDRESSWQGIVAGRSVSRWLTPPAWTGPDQIAGAPLQLPTDRPFRHAEPLIELAQTTAHEALTDAGLYPSSLTDRIVGVVYGTSKGGLHSFSEQFVAARGLNGDAGNGVSTPTAESWLDVFPNRPAIAIQQLIGGTGPVLCPIAACATGLAACLRAVELVQYGDCDVVLAGSADASLQPALLGSFRRLGVLSKETNDPASACRPFDRNRSGFVIGEGAACLVFERLESARARNATCYAEWLGGGLLSDPFGLTQLDPNGRSLRRLLRNLCSHSSAAPDYINLHGTGTATNDRVESQAIRAVFESDADQIECSSLKGGLGHLLGAAGSVELAATLLAMRDQLVPPTTNHSERDPDCPLEIVSGNAIPRQINSAWKISMGFGGHIAGAAFGRC